MSNINKYTTKEVLNKVLLDSSGDAVNAYSHTSQEALNTALDATNNRLNVSLKGGTISGDVTISGDLTVNGDGSGNYDEIVNGNLVLSSGSKLGVGIGDAVPSAPVHVSVAAQDGRSSPIETLRLEVSESFGNVDVGSNQGPAIDFYVPVDSNTSQIGGRIAVGHENGTDSDSAAKLTFTTAPDGSSLNANPAMTIDSSGNVGIGHSNPQDTLSLSSSSGAGLNIIRADSAITSGERIGQISFVGTENSHSNFGYGARIEALATEAWTEGSAEGTKLVFHTTDNSSATLDSRMTIDHNGNVGIGVTPDTNLHIHKATAGTVSANANAQVAIENSSHAGLQFLSPNSANNIIYFGDVDDNDVGYIGYLHGSNSMEFVVNTASAMTIDSSGNVGIGTSSPAAELELVKDGAPSEIFVTSYRNDAGQPNFAGRHARGSKASPAIVQDGDTLWQAQAYGYDGDGDFNSFAGGIQIQVDGTPGANDMPGRIRFLTTADGAGSWTERMRIDSSGRVGIGTSSPAVSGGVGLDIEDSTASGGSKGGSLRLGSNDGSPVAQNDRLGVINFCGAEDSSGTMTEGGRIDVIADSGWSATENGADMRFFTTDGNASDTEKMRITAEGYVGIGSTPTHGKLEIVGDSDAYQLVMSDVADSDNTTKEARIGMMHYKQAEEPVTLMYASSSSSANTIIIGGGTGVGNHATNINFAMPLDDTYNDLDTKYVFKLDANSRISLSNNDAGTDNTVFGFMAGTALASGGVENTLVGDYTGTAITTGDYNTAVGKDALKTDDVGRHSTAIGYSALLLQNTASEGSANNTGVGVNVGAYNVTGTNNTWLGANAGLGASGQSNSYNTGVGSDALKVVTTGQANTAVGYSAMAAETDGGDNVAVGQKALLALTGSTRNTVVGASAMRVMDDTADGLADCTVVGAQAFYGNATNTTTGANGTTAIGAFALKDLTTGTGNVAVGYQSGKAITTGGYSTFIGYNAGLVHTTGGYNMAIGYGAMDDTNAGNNSLGSTENTFIGVDSGGGTWEDTSSSYNVGIGNYVMDDALDGASYNTAVGQNSMSALTEGDYNTALGRASAHSLTTGTQNVLLGYGAVTSTASGQNQIVLGYETTGQANNSVTLGNASVTAVYMAQDSGATVHCLDVAPTDGTLKENLLPNSGFDVWSNSTLENVGSNLVTGWTNRTAVPYDTFTSSGANITDAHNTGGDSAQAHAEVNLTPGKLYKISVNLTLDAGTAPFIGFQSSVGGAAGGLDAHLLSAGSNTVIIEAVANDNFFMVNNNASNTEFQLSSVSIYEVTPGCVANDTKAPDGWQKRGGDVDIWREHNHSTYSKDGSFYSLKVTSVQSAWNLAVVPDTDTTELQKYSGRTVTFGAWVYSTLSTPEIRLSIYDNGGETNSSSPAQNTWTWLEVTKTIASDPTAVQFEIDKSGSTSETYYISQPMLVFGNSIGSGNYTRPQGEIVYLETSLTSAKLNGSAFSDVSETTLNVEADSLGKIPKGAKAVMTELKARDSGSAGTDCWVALGTGEKSMLRLTGLANDSIHHESSITPCDSNGDFTYRVDASGSSTLDAWALYHGVQLR